MDQRIDIPVQLLEFQRAVQQCGSQRELMFVAVNESYKVLRYDQAVVWHSGARSRIAIGAVSGLAEVPAQTPYGQWLTRAIEWLRGNRPGTAALTYEELPEDLVQDGREWVHQHLLHTPLAAPDGGQLGGMLFHREEPFDETEQAVAGWLGNSVGFALWAWRPASGGLQRLLTRRSTGYLLAGALAAVALLALYPVRLSALAPAEITPTKPIAITSPVEGVVGRITVQPNSEVKVDQVLVELDDTSIRNRLAVARKALDIAKADYQRAANKAFSDESSKADLLVLDSRAKEKAAEVGYLIELLSRLRIATPQGGIAIFSDPEDWRGRPVQPGERIMIVADPSLVGVTVYLPPDDAVQLDVGGEVTLFLNTAPLSPIKATIVQTSYEAEVQPDNTLAYVIKAALAPNTELPRIGSRGTAKVYGETASLGYYLLRKPIFYVRRNLGI